MELEQLKSRSSELGAEIINRSNQLLIMQGHKNEVDYQIKVLIEAEESIETEVELEV